MFWRLLPYEVAPGARHMAVDEAIFEAVESGQSPPTFRLYGWHPACVSLGCHQKAEHELDLDAVSNRGWSIVKRATGGRAVLHIEELTYMAVIPLGAYPWGATVAGSHAALASALRASLLGPLSKRATGAEGERIPRPHSSRIAAPCFASSSRDEVLWEGRKWIGSAQKRGRRALLQHGAIPLTPRFRELPAVMRLGSEQKKAWEQVLEQKSTCLQEIVPLESMPAGWMDAFPEQVCKALGVEARWSFLSTEENRRAEELERTKREKTSYEKD